MKLQQLSYNKVVIFLLLNGVISTFGAVVHKSFSHGHHEHQSLNQERESDGAFSPHSNRHYDDDGLHNVDFDHEAILGSAKEAEEFDHLPPEEAKRRLGILLKKMDLSNDGYIDRKELKEWILKSFRMLSKEEATERLEDSDDDHDGKVSWAEYLSDTFGIDSDDDESLNEEHSNLIVEDKEMWQAADKDGDGLLDSSEFEIFTNPEEHTDMVPLILNQTLRSKDKDEDGAISFQEFMGDRGLDMDMEALRSEQIKFEHEYDKDKDGKLTGNEIISWIVPSNEEVADEEVAHLFGHTDDDHDDLLSFDEILEHHEMFVGSEVTDYGEHLHNIHQFDDEL